MFKRILAKLIIFSLFFNHAAFAMRPGSWAGQEDGERKKTSLNLPKVRSSGHLPEASSDPLDKEIVQARLQEDVEPVDFRLPPPPQVNLPEDLWERGLRELQIHLAQPDDNVEPVDFRLPQEPPEEEDQEVFEEEEGFFLVPANQRSLREMAPLLGNPGRGDQQPDRTLRVLNALGAQPDTFTEEEREALKRLLKVELTWRNPIIWANLEHLFSKSLFALTTSKKAVNLRKQWKCCDPLWLYGGPVPLDSHAASKRNLALKTLTHTFEEVTLELLHTMLFGLFWVPNLYGHQDRSLSF